MIIPAIEIIPMPDMTVLERNRLSDQASLMLLEYPNATTLITEVMAEVRRRDFLPDPEGPKLKAGRFVFWMTQGGRDGIDHISCAKIGVNGEVGEFKLLVNLGELRYYLHPELTDHGLPDRFYLSVLKVEN